MAGTNNNIHLYLKTLRLKGYLAYEYNPFYNYQTAVNLYRIDTNVGEILVPEGCAVNKLNGLILKNIGTSDNKIWTDKFNTEVDNINVSEINVNTEKVADSGSLMDLVTDKLNFDLEHPVDITILPSYDGSVNLILNDNKNIPRLINSRFSAREKNTYEIVDRIGENDTNIYNSSTFDKDTSLYFLYEYNPIITYMGFIRGVLRVGLYCFYFTYCDADDNESDFIAETGVIPVFIGTDRDPNSIDGGIKNQQTDKGIKLKLTNMDKSYNYLKIYYVRYFADYQLNRVYEAKKIAKRYPINSDTLYLLITGYEDTDLIDANILNLTKFNPKSVLTQAQCKNMLFFGNIVKNIDNYRELRDCALRITAFLDKKEFSRTDVDYESVNGAYYNSQNAVNSVGYFNNEYYRFGVVFIYQNGTLSNVYNTLGFELTDEKETPIIVNKKEIFKKNNSVVTREYISVTEDGWINDLLFEEDVNYINAKGVYKISCEEEDSNTIYGIRFNVPNNVIEHLKTNLGIRGLFFVRQKRIPNVLALCYLLPIDEQLEAPVIEYKLENNILKRTECFVTLSNNSGDGGRIISNYYEDRLYTYGTNSKIDDSISKNAYAGICPDFLLNLPYYNQIFNGSLFRIKQLTDGNYLTKSNRFYKENNTTTYLYSGEKSSELILVTINSVTEEVPTIAIKDKVYRLEMGEAEEAFRFRYAEVDNGTYDAGGSMEIANNATNIVRGKFSPYLAIYCNRKLNTSELYNIYRDSLTSEFTEFLNRMDSSEPFYSISDRYNFEGLDLNSDNKYCYKTCWRGDCFLNTFTYRLNRNFNDPSLPNNDQIIDRNTWKDNYRVDKPEDWTNISRSDLNAVQLGSWITFKVRSYMNYAFRSLDHSYVEEEALMGAPRSFYPKSHMMWRGENKMPDSYLYNDAFRATLGFKCYFALLDVNYIKDTFSNRIQYSAISILDSYKNNYRDSLSTYFRDYSQEYGSILKLVGFEGYLLVIFEHAIGVAVVNERIISGEGDGEPVFINTNNVLPEEVTIITDTYGTLWPDSVIKSEAGYVYGVDTIAKKIWRVKGQEIEILSDFKVGKFLIDNITLGERELYPVVGLKNVKTHYNNNKKDVMFTFYDDVYMDEEKAWNLCYNELLGEFITFYSWIPAFSENIDTQFFTFDRNTAKKLALLRTSNYNIPTNYGVLVNCPVLDKNNKAKLYYRPFGKGYLTLVNSDGTISTREVEIETDKNIVYKFDKAKDHWGNYNRAIITTTNNLTELEIKTNDTVFDNRYDNFVGAQGSLSVDNNGNIINTLLLTQNETAKNDYNNALYEYNNALGEYDNANTNYENAEEEEKEYYLNILNTIKADVATKYNNLNEKTIALNTSVTELLLYRDKVIGLWDYIISTYKKDLSSVFKLSINSVNYYNRRDLLPTTINYNNLPNKNEINSTVSLISNTKCGCLTKEFYDWVTGFESSEQMSLSLGGGLILLYITPYVDTSDSLMVRTTYPTELIAVCTKDFINNELLTLKDLLTAGLTTDFYLHGQAGIFNVTENTYPTRWYNEWHPFEFEFVVNDNISFLKIFTNLVIISNKAEPESFHFEIEGDNYEFSRDKRTMYFRLEATKNLFLNLGSDMLYDRYFTDVAGYKYTQELYYRGGLDYKYTINGRFNFDKVYPVQYEGLVKLVKSTIFPLYYERVDTFDDIYHKYRQMIEGVLAYDFKNLSGSEIKWYRDLNLFNIVTHIKNNPIDLVGRLRGNSYYKEGKWNVLIPSISFMLRNEGEDDWINLENTSISNFGSPLGIKTFNKIPPIVINSSNIPNDLSDKTITEEKLPNVYYDNKYTTITKTVNLNTWTYRKETKIRDKWIKIRIRYSGKNLAVIHSVATLYNISYS